MKKYLLFRGYGIPGNLSKESYEEMDTLDQALDIIDRTKPLWWDIVEVESATIIASSLE